MMVPAADAPYGMGYSGRAVVLPRSGGGHSPPSSPRHTSVPMQAHIGKDSLRIDMEIKFPKQEKRKKNRVVEKKNTVSVMSSIFTEQKYPEPVYFQNVDCVGIPHFFTRSECKHLIDLAEGQGFSMQNRHRVLNMSWSDVVDPFLANAIYELCGVGWFLRKIVVDGQVPCGINDVIRIQKFGQGGIFGRHTDQPLKREDGRISKYSLRVFLNGAGDREFEGGQSAFHVSHRPEPVVFEPEVGLALLYPQGEFCHVQEEYEVLFGHKYVLRADILFCRPEDLKDAGPYHYPSPTC